MGFKSQEGGISFADRTCSSCGPSSLSALKRDEFVWMLPSVISGGGFRIQLIGSRGENKYFVCSFFVPYQLLPAIWGIGAWGGTVRCHRSVFLQRDCAAITFDLR